MSFALLHPRDQIVTMMGRIYDHDMTTTSGGNLSILDEEGNIWITPARIDKGSLRPEHIVCITPKGEIIGNHPPSSENPFHRQIYAARPDLRAIIHAHPSGLVSFSMCARAPQTRLFPETWKICGEPAFAPYALPGSEKLGQSIAAEFGRASKPNCVILENHGVAIGGTDLLDAFRRFETLEFTAQTELYATRLGEPKVLTEAQLAMPESRPLPTAATTPAGTPGNREKEARKAIRDFVRRAYSHRLMTSTWGSYSARLDDDSFLITPYGVDRGVISLDDLVVVKGDSYYGAHPPSRAAQLHAAIYAKNPEINSVVNALPVHATAFSVCAEKLDTRTIPESYLFLKDVPCLPYRDLYTDVDAIAAHLGPTNPVALLEHNGAIVAGRTVLDAFDRLEVLEATASAILRSRILGPIRPMSDDVIDELVTHFGNV
jgi:L-fuculose-phosphate aldolase